MILLFSLFFEAVVRNGIVALRKEEAKQIVTYDKLSWVTIK